MKIILAIDGGGVRGIMEAAILKEIEKRLRIATKKNVYLADYLDVISGASTGGIISAILACPNELGGYKYDCNDTYNFYNDHCYEIFNKSKRILGAFTYKYSEKALEKYLDKYFGKLQVKDFKKHVIIPTVDLNTSEAYFFSNVKVNADKSEYSIKDVLRCTSAAPTYFKPKETGNIVGIDGGMVANDTAICCVSKLQKYDDTKLQDICLINIGSGSVKPVNKNITSTWTVLKWATHITNIMLFANVGLVKYQLEQLDFGKTFLIDIPKEFRCYNDDMADASKENLDKLKDAAQKTIIVYDEKINELVNFLIKNN